MTRGISLSAEWKFLPQQMVEIPPTDSSMATRRQSACRPASFFSRSLESRSRATIGSGWMCNIRGRIHHGAVMRARCPSRLFDMDKYPVTNADYKKFLEAAGYRPADDHNFLRDWTKTDPCRLERQASDVGVARARAYAKWAGKQLPRRNWQYAAQGPDERVYPWGNQWDEQAVPHPYQGRDLPGPAGVDDHPRGASPFGVMDLVGNVWQWTDEFVDEHTRAAIVRGGSYYQPQGSMWYFPQAYKLNEHGKYLLMAPSKDRAGTIGFRCVRKRK